MRINVYAEEITSDVQTVYTHAEDKVFQGLRFYLDSSEKLHHTVADDDRSAVTFWGSAEKLRTLFQIALRELLMKETTGV